LIQFSQDSESRTSHLSAAAALPSKESVFFTLPVIPHTQRPLGVAVGT